LQWTPSEWTEWDRQQAAAVVVGKVRPRVAEPVTVDAAHAAKRVRGEGAALDDGTGQAPAGDSTLARLRAALAKAGVEDSGGSGTDTR
jgi:hypothetical protein